MSSDSTDTIAELQYPDEARPAKRARLDGPLSVTKDTQQEMDDDDGWDDVYGGVKPAMPVVGGENSAYHQKQTYAAPLEYSQPQLGLSGMQNHRQEMDDGVPAEAIATNDDLVAPPALLTPDGSDQATSSMMQETTKVEFQPLISGQGTDQSKSGGAVNEEQASLLDRASPPIAKPAVPEDVTSIPDTTHGEVPNGKQRTVFGAPNAVVKVEPKETNDQIMADAETTAVRSKPSDDPQFMAAAAAQKNNSSAEWQYDSSDAESSSDSDSSDSSDSLDESDSGSEGGYEMLDPATAARILMTGEGDDDDGEKSKGKTDYQPRTANEVKRDVIPKPDVNITPDMKITLLGNIESIVDNMILIKGATPGEYQVLEEGAVLCNGSREVVGAVADTFGRVQQPLYSVAFSSPQEIEESGLKINDQIFYVDSHSTFVFTQPLKNSKGTDASNIHDEEIGEDEMEFSDDEKEAEYKRHRKQAKKAGRGGLSRSAFQGGERSFGAPGHNGGPTYVDGGDAPTQTYGSGLSYDDDEPAEEFYQPLKRPDNLSQIMSSGALPPRPQQPSFDRGRGRGRGDRGRGRGDRGRGRGASDRQNQRGGRGSFKQHDRSSQGHRGNAHSYPDRHQSDTNADPQHTLPPKPTAPQGTLASPPAPQAQYQQPPPPPQSYQFNGYTFQFGNQAPPPQYSYPTQQPPRPNPAGSTPAGSHVNPAFYQQQAQQQQAYAAWYAQFQQQQQHVQPPAGAAQGTGGAPQQSYPAWNGQYPQQQHQQYAQPQMANAQASFGAQTQQQESEQPSVDISAILKRLGGS